MANNQREVQARSIIQNKMKQIDTLVGNDKKKSSSYGSALVSLGSNYNLKNCSVESVLDVGFQIVQAGLNPNPLFGQAYVVPFKLKNGGEMAQLQIGYKGWVALGYRNGWKFKAVPVYKCDDFDIEFGGFEDIIHLAPNYDARDESNGKWVHNNLVGVIVYAKDSGNDIFTEFVSFKKLEKLRLKSQNQNSADKLTYIWADWAEEMYKSKALKYVITRLPVTEEIFEAAIIEDQPIREEQKEQPKADLNAMITQNPTQGDNNEVSEDKPKKRGRPKKDELPEHDLLTGEIVDAEQVDSDEETNPFE